MIVPLKPIPLPKRRGWKKGRARKDRAAVEAQQAADNDRTATWEARRRMYDPKDKRPPEAFAAACYGVPHGMAIAFHCQTAGASLPDLWQTWNNAVNARARYVSLVLDRQENPQSAAIQVIPDRAAACADAPDPREYDERHRAAVDAWADVLFGLSRVPNWDRVLLKAALWGTVPELWRDAAPTRTGADFALAVERLHAAMKRK
jgi:hypothetical protein